MLYVNNNSQTFKHIMAIFQDDDVKMHQAQIVKERLGGSMKYHFYT